MLESDTIGHSPTENTGAYNAANDATQSPEEEENARLSALYDTYCAPVYGMAAHVVGVGPIAEAVVEEVFVRAWRAGVDVWTPSDEATTNDDSRDHEGRQQPMEAARTWLIRLTYALAVAILRSARRCTRCKSLQEHRAHLPPLSGLLLTGLGMDGVRGARSRPE